MNFLRIKDFPFLLQQIYNPPKVLHSRGALLSHDTTYVAIVGTRLPSEYGKRMAYLIAKRVTEAGGTVVSGLAFGVDALTHKAAIDLGRPTVAVLASGVERVTPSSHVGLARAIVKHGGTLLSEYERFDSAHKYRFLERNRIISGLCAATIVIEAKEKSGALITARHAFDQNREVHALVGNVDRSQAQGCLKLITDNVAKPLVDIDELLKDLKLDIQKKCTEKLSTVEQKILECLEEEFPLDRLLCSPAEIGAALSMLELHGLIQRQLDGSFRLKSR